MKDAVYKKSFGLFLKKTDEKSVVKQFIYENISIHKNTNFLDIGGGSGSLALVISKKVKKTFIIEPNKDFCKQLLKQKKIKVLNDKWENIRLNDTFDFILAAYVATYFPQTRRKYLIKKMYDLLRHGGCILILSVDAKKGSWRKIHSYFYRLMGHPHKSSDDELKKIARDYRAVSKSFKTHVIAKDADEMLEILGFDFYKHPKEFSRFRDHLKFFLNRYSNNNGKVTLEMVHNAHIITKK